MKCARLTNFFFSSRRRHTRFDCDWSSDVCSSDLDVHLMVEEPLSKLDGFVGAGADIITVHVESSRHVHRALQALGRMENTNDPQRGIVRGLALNPGTPLESIDPLVDELDMVLLLA